MNPIHFPEASHIIGPPEGTAVSQVAPIHAYVHEIKGGSLDGVRQVIVAWQPTAADLAQLLEGKPIFISMLGGLAPHCLSVDFKGLTKPA